MSEAPPASPSLAAAREARAAQAVLAAEGDRPRPIPPPTIRDPLPLCVYTTVALLAWIVSPPLVAAALSLRPWLPLPWAERLDYGRTERPLPKKPAIRVGA